TEPLLGDLLLDRECLGVVEQLVENGRVLLGRPGGDVEAGVAGAVPGLLQIRRDDRNTPRQVLHGLGHRRQVRERGWRVRLDADRRGAQQAVYLRRLQPADESHYAVEVQGGDLCPQVGQALTIAGDDHLPAVATAPVDEDLRGVDGEV